MNWTWNIRSNDGAMNGLEFARCTTAGGFSQVLIHAAPSKAKIEIVDDDDQLIARADLDRSGEYSPMTLVKIDGRALYRSEVWPTEDLYGLPVLLAGGEVGILHQWQHAEDHSWWRWSVEFSNHTGRPADWAPPGQHSRRGPGQDGALGPGVRRGAGGRARGHARPAHHPIPAVSQWKLPVTMRLTTGTSVRNHRVEGW